MEMKRYKRFALVVMLLGGISFSSCSGGGEEEYQFSDWDQDGNELLDENEFSRAYVQTAYQDRWDTNRDKEIDENEWESGVANYWVPYDIGEYGAFSTWDSDLNDRLSEDEFWERIFEFYDKDGDQFLSEAEYNTWIQDSNQ